MDKTIILIFIIKLIFWTQTEATQRWSRQISNSDWVPLTHHRPSQRSDSHSQENVFSSSSQINRGSSVSLSPPLQKQYQDQLLQLQRTQESIEKLLNLQEQLRIQQQLLQSHAYIQDGITNRDQDKETFHQSRIQNVQAIPQLVPDVLMPPNAVYKSSSPIFSESNPQLKDERQKLRGSGTSKLHHNSENRFKVNREHYFKDSKQDASPDEAFESHKRYKNDNKVKFLPQPWSKQDESDEEIQLVYVPAETLLQNSQEKNEKERSRKKQNLNNYQDSQGVQLQPSILSQKSFSLKHFDQSQDNINEEDQFFQEEGIKEILPLHGEQKDFQKNSQVFSNSMTRNHEPDIIKDEIKQTELPKVYEGREKQEQERRKLIGSRTKEGRIKQNQDKEQYDKQTPLERKKDTEYQRNINYQSDMDYSREAHRLKENRRILPRQKQSSQTAFRQLPSRNEPYMTQDYQFNEDKIPQSLINNEQHYQYFTNDPDNVTNNRKNKFQPQIDQHYSTDDEDDVTTTSVSPNQPPLSIYLSTKVEPQKVDVNDLLELLQNAKSIAVVDVIHPNTPKVFVGPAYLETPPGYVKFDLPYLSSIEHYLFDKDVQRFPFFVAPLSFVPRRGYFKIPFPAPHIGSIIVSTIEKTTESEDYKNRHNSSPSTEFNSYTFNSYQTPNDKIATTTDYSTGVVDSSLYKESQFYQDQKPLFPAVDTEKEQLKNIDYFNNFPSSSGYHDTSFVTPSYQTNSPQSTLQYEKEMLTIPDSQTGKHLYNPTYVTENQEQNLHNHHVHNSNVEPLGPTATNTNYPSHYEPEKKQVIKSSQYNLSAKLPAISSQLPGLVNSLMEKNEEIHSLTTPLTTSTTTTTTEASPTTVRSRGRQRVRVVPTKSTTLHPPVKSATNRSQRPFTRSRTRLTTTTEKYQRSSYEPKKSKPETTNRHYTENESRNPSNEKNQKVRGRNKINQSKSGDHLPNEQGYSSNQQQAEKAYSHQSSTVYSINDDEAPKFQSGSTFQNIGSQEQSSNYSDFINQQIYQQDRQFTNNSSRSPYTNEDLRYQTEATPSTLKDYSYYLPKKTGNKGYTNVDPTQVSELDESYQQEYLQYNGAFPSHVNLKSPNDNYESTERINYETYQTGVTNNFDTSHYDYSTDQPTELTEFPVTPTTLNARVLGVIKEKPRERLNERVQQEVQTHHNKMQPEYVRITSTINQHTKKSSPNLGNRNRENISSRLRTRTRPNFKDSQIQVDGQHYVRIQSAMKDKESIVSSATPESVTTLEEPETLEEYGFFKPPNFQSTHSEENVHLRTKENQGHIKNEQDSAGIYADSVITQKHDSKKRPMYLSFNRNYPNSITTTRTTPISFEQSKNTSTSKSNTDETKVTKIRGRVRRPGRKRITTTTTEAALEDRNELQFNENYFHMAEVTPKSFSTTNNKQLYFNRRNLPNRKQGNLEDPQEFVLNVPKTYSNQNEQSTIPFQKYIQSSSGTQKHLPLQQSSDIYEAESQWSTKLSGNAYQQTYSLHDIKNLENNNTYLDSEENKQSFQETTTVGTDTEISITIQPLVNYENIYSQDVTSSENNNVEHTENSGMITILNNDDNNNHNINDYNNIKNSNTSNGNNINVEGSKIQTVNEFNQENIKADSNEELTTESRIKNESRRKVGFRRRKVKVRVSPVSEEFVTAESQNYGSPVNILIKQSNKDSTFNDKFHDTKSSFSITQEETSSKVNNDYVEMLKVSSESIDVIKETTMYPSTDAVRQTNEIKEFIDETTIKVERTTKPKVQYFDEIFDFTENPNSFFSSEKESNLEDIKTQTQAKESSESLNVTKVDNTIDNSINISTVIHPKNHRLEWSEIKSTNSSLYEIAKNETMNSRTQTMLENVKDGSRNSKNKTNKISDYVQAIFDSIKNDNENMNVERSFLRPVQFNNHQTTKHSVEDITKEHKNGNSNFNITNNLFSKPPEVTKLGEILRTSTTTKVSHMTEICYRGRCVMTKPKVDHST